MCRIWEGREGGDSPYQIAGGVRDPLAPNGILHNQTIFDLGQREISKYRPRRHGLLTAW